MTAPLTFTAVYALRRPVTGAAVHLALPGDDRAVCGARRGEDAPGGPTCFKCRQAGAPQVPAATGPAAEFVARCGLDGLRASIDITGSAARVWFSWNELLAALIRRIPGADWHREARCWTIPAAFAPALAEAFRSAGVSVIVDQQPAWPALLLDGLDPDTAGLVHHVLSLVLPPGSAQRVELETGYGAYLRHHGRPQ